MRTAIIKISKLSDPTNKRSCLSASRPLKQCFKCNSYDKCESRIENYQYNRLKKQLGDEQERHFQEVSRIRQEMKTV